MKRPFYRLALFICWLGFMVAVGLLIKGTHIWLAYGILFAVIVLGQSTQRNRLRG